MTANSPTPETSRADRTVSHAIARLHAGILAVVLGLLCGFGLFVMTVWLVIKGGPTPGAHLELLSQYLIGYSVSWVGAVIGLLYGILIGGIIGWTVGWVYNRIAEMRHPQFNMRKNDPSGKRGS